MRRYLLILPILFLLIFTACAGTLPSKKPMSDDMGSPEKESLLKARAGEFWSAFTKEDYETIYALYDPFFRAKTEKYVFFGQLGKIKYHDFSIQSVKLEGNVAKVTMKITYSMPTAKVKTQEFSVPKTTTDLTETWLYIYDNWYKEFYIYSLEAGVASY